jgi:hypothetical protein
LSFTANDSQKQNLKSFHYNRNEADDGAGAPADVIKEQSVEEDF